MMPTEQELIDAAERATNAHDELHALLSRLWWRGGHADCSPAGTIARRFTAANAARIAYDELRREYYPTPGEVEARREAAAAFADLEAAGIDPRRWHYMTRLDTAWEFAHADRRDAHYHGPRWLHLARSPQPNAPCPHCGADDNRRDCAGIYTCRDCGTYYTHNR